MITTTPSRLRKQSKSKRSRRGGTLVVVAIMFTVLMGISAMALDFSREQAFDVLFIARLEPAARG